jgi:electron transport complex protein RnfC
MRMSPKFIGGVHPHDSKAPANSQMVDRLAPPPQVILPVSLHIGAPCQPLVAVGDTVKLGQKIADSPAAVSAPIHASVSGKVIAIEPRLHSNGMMVNSIVIENDGLDTPAETMVPYPPETAEDPDAIVKAIREAGIVRMGGAPSPPPLRSPAAKERWTLSSSTPPSASLTSPATTARCWSGRTRCWAASRF